MPPSSRYAPASISRLWTGGRVRQSRLVFSVRLEAAEAPVSEGGAPVRMLTHTCEGASEGQITRSANSSAYGR